MKTYRLFILIFSLIFTLSASGQDKPSIGFEELITASEENPQMIIQAKLLTAQLDIPHTIYLPEGIFVQALGVENDRVVYAIYHNLVDIYDNGETAYWTKI